MKANLHKRKKKMARRMRKPIEIKGKVSIFQTPEWEKRKKARLKRHRVKQDRAHERAIRRKKQVEQVEKKVVKKKKSWLFG